MKPASLKAPPVVKLAPFSRSKLPAARLVLKADNAFLPSASVKA